MVCEGRDDIMLCQSCGRFPEVSIIGTSVLLFCEGFGGKDGLDQLPDLAGISITTVSGKPQEAIELLSSGEFEAVLVDCSSSSGEALELIGDIRSRGLEIPVIVLTRPRQKDVLPEAMEAGADSFLELKPDPKETAFELEHRIKFSLRGKCLQVDLEKSEERFRVLFEMAPDAYYLSDLEGRFIDGNRRAEEITGYRREELIGKNFLSAGILPVGYVPKALKLLAKNALGLPTGPDEFVLKRKGGGRITVGISTVPVQIDCQNLVLGIARDITRTIKIEEALLESKEKYRTLVDNASEGIIVVQEDRLIYANPEACRIFGSDKQDLIRKPVTKWLHPDDCLQFHGDDHQEQGTTLAKEEAAVRIIGSDGSIRWTEAKKLSITWLSRPARLIFLSDVTERHEAEEDLKSRDVILASVDFIAERLLSHTNWEDNIHAVLERLGEAAKVNRVYLCENQVGRNGNIVPVLRAEWQDHSQPGWNDPRPESTGPPARASGWWSEVLQSGRCVFGNAREFPPPEQEILESRLVKSLVIVPIFVGKQWWGQIEFDDGIQERTWQAPEVDALRTAANIIGSAIQRTRIEEIFHIPVERSLVGVFLIDDYKVAYANPRMGSIFGYKPGEITGKKIEELVHPDDIPAIRERIGELLAGKLDLGSTEFRGIRKDGEPIYIEAYDSRTTYEGRPAIVGNLLDITERKRSVEALRKSEEKYRQLMEVAQEGIWAIDDTGITSYVNPRLTEILGYSYEELVGKPPFQFMNDKERPFAEENLHRRKRQSSGFLASEFTRKDGRKVVASVSISPMKDETGRPAGILALVSDITDRKAAEDALRASEAKYRGIVENLQEVIFSLDFDGRITYISPGIERIDGIPAADVIGEPFSAFIHEDDLPAINTIFRDLLDGKNAPSSEFRIKNRYGQLFHFRQSGHLLLDDGKPAGITGVLIDITTQKRGEEAIQQRDAILEAINFAGDCFLKTAAWEACVDRVLDRLGTAAAASNVAIFAFVQAGDGVVARKRFEWHSPGVPSLTEADLPLESLAIAASRSDQVPEYIPLSRSGSIPEKAQLIIREGGLQKFLAVPIIPGDEAWGFLALGESRHEHAWSPVELESLRAAAGIFGSTIWRARYEKQLEVSLEDKTVLLREVHHRVKNNMQVISSLLNLQSMYIHDAKVLQNLKETESRINSMALVHERLYLSEGIASINVGEYVSNLASKLISIYSQKTSVSLVTDIEDLSFDIDTMVPVGLIINEIVSNSLKHGFCDREQGRITISIKRVAGGMVEMVMGDNGAGMPQGIDLNASATLGLLLITMLTQQVDGTVRIEPGEGTRYRILFPLPEPESGHGNHLPGRPGLARRDGGEARQ